MRNYTVNFILMLAVILAVFSFSPAVGLADNTWAINDPIVPCGISPVDKNAPSTSHNAPCKLVSLFHLVGHLIYMAIYLTIPLSTILFAYAGFKYMFATGNENEIKTAHIIFKNTVVGILIVLGAWLLVFQIVEPIVKPAFILLQK